ncbi:MAG: site-specific integrase, partial [Myxococcota bacterium]
LIEAGTISPRYVRNCIGIVSSIFRLAVLEEAADVNPVSQTPRDGLPAASRGGGPTYTAAEVVQLLGAERVDLDRRVLYAMQAMTGMRVGECCGRRWEDWDRAASPLGALRIHTQYNDQPLKTAKTGNNKERRAPVHPHLAAILDYWWRQGFASTYGRAPNQRDFIVPSRSHRHLGPMTQSQITKAHRRDAARAGVPNKGTHALRRFMISAARSGGAQKDVLERITHNARGDIIDIYTTLEWSTLCAAIRAIRLDESAPHLGPVYDISYDIDGTDGAKPSQSLRLLGGGGGNRRSMIRGRLRQVQGITRKRD